MPGGIASETAPGLVGEERLDSWKEIASFFERDQRTVKRWEKTRALPVHRIPGGQRGGVFAYAHELRNWLDSTAGSVEPIIASPSLDQAPAAPDSFPSPAPLDPHFLGMPEPKWPTQPSPAPVPATLVSAVPVPATAVLSPRVPALPLGPWVRPASVLLATGLLASLVGVAFLFLNHRSAPQPAPAPPRSAPAQPLVVHSPQATELYLKGRYYWNRRTGDSLATAIDAFSKAITLDPNYAEAYAGLADCYDLLREYTSMSDAEAYPRAIAAAEKAVALNDSLAEAHRALAFSLFYWKWDFPRAFTEYQRAIELNPSDPDAYHWYATSLLSMGRFQEALAEIEHARSLNPASPSILADRAFILFYSGERSRARTALEELEQAEPAFLSPPRYLARLDLVEGEYQDFLTQLERVATISKDRQDVAMLRAARQGWAAGGSAALLAAIEPIQQQAVTKGYSSGFDVAYTCLLLGRRRDALRYLEAAYTARDPSLLGLEQSRFESDLRGVPAYERLRKKIQERVEFRSNAERKDQVRST